MPRARNDLIPRRRATVIKVKSSSTSKPIPFCERSFSLFFLVWGLSLLLDYQFGLGTKGIFQGKLETYLPSCVWGNGFALIGFGRLIAFYLHSSSWRVRFAFVHFIVLLIIASIAIYSRLWATTAPLSLFIAYISFWCYRATKRDVELGL